MAYSSSSSSSSSSRYATRSATAGASSTAPSFTAEYLAPYNDGMALGAECGFPLIDKAGSPPCGKECKTAEECASARCKTHLHFLPPQAMEYYIEMERQAQATLIDAQQRKLIAAYRLRMEKTAAKTHSARQKERQYQAKSPLSSFVRPASGPACPPRALPAPINHGTKRLCDDEDVSPLRKRLALSVIDDANPCYDRENRIAAALPYTDEYDDVDDDDDDDDNIDVASVE